MRLSYVQIKMDTSFFDDIRCKIAEFPCTFNLIDADRVKRSKVKTVRHNIESELEIGGDDETELIRKKNLLTWAFFRLGKRDKAVELSNELIDLTKGSNISSLGNRVFVTLATGDSLEAKKCWKQLERMKDDRNFNTFLTEAKAEQAYCYSRLGGAENLELAIRLFSEAMEVFPDRYLWKYGLGLCFKRVTNVNVYCSSKNSIDVEEYKKRAVQYLFEVADNSNTTLQAMAYAELTDIRRYTPSTLYPYFDELFRGLGVKELCQKALKHGEQIPSVLKECGKALRSFDIDESIRLLELSARIKESTVTLHHLGISYTVKAERMAKSANKSSSQQGQVLHSGTQVFDEAASSSSSQPSLQGPYNDVTTQRLPKGNNAHGLSSTDRITSEMPVLQGAMSCSGATDNEIVFLPSNSAIGSSYNLHRSMPTNSQCPGPSWFSGTSLSKEPNTMFSTPPLSNCYPTSRTGRGRFRQCRRRTGATCSGKSERGFNLSPQTPVKRSVSCSETHDPQPLPLSTPTPSSSTRSRSLNRGAYQNRRERSARHRGRAGRGGYTRSHSENWSPQDELKAYIRHGKKDCILDKNDQFVQKAISSYKRAIEISEQNLPAVFNLGLILKKTGQIKEALKMFNRVVVYDSSPKGHIVTVICAYEEAGLCYLKLGETDESGDNYEEESRDMLLKAVSLAASLAAAMPEMKESPKNVWTAFMRLIVDIDQRPQSRDKKKQKIKLLKLVDDNEEIAKIVRELMQQNEINDFDDQETVTTALENFLRLDRPEDALTLQTLIGIRPVVHDFTWWNEDVMRALRAKVFLHAVYRRLKYNKGTPTFLFQQLFELSYGACVGLNAVVRDEEEPLANGNVVGDVLVVYDDDQHTSEGPSLTMRLASCVKDVVSCLFGLEAQKNLERVGDYGFAPDLKLKEMGKYQIVVVVLGDEPRDRMFDSVLELIRTNKRNQEPPNHKILVLDVGSREGNIPRCLEHYDRFRLEDIGGLGDIHHERRGEDDEEDEVPWQDIMQQVFRRDVDAALKLFCFLTGNTWPCP